MTTAAIATLERALTLDDIAEIRAGIAQALGSLRQGPRVLNALELHARLNAEIRRHGTMSATAAHFGVAKQTLHAVLNGDRPCPPSIFAASRARARAAWARSLSGGVM